MQTNEEKYCPYCGRPRLRYFSVETAAQLLDCSEQAIRNWIRDREIGFVKFGRLVRIPETEIVRKGKRIASFDEATEVALRSKPS